MTKALRVIDTGVQAARWNVAMTAALAELHGAGRIADTLRFHVYPRCVLIGRHQAAAEAVDRAFCSRNGIDLARRVTGGGAVYMSPGVLAWDLVMPRRSLGALDEAAAKICGAVAVGLSRLGLDARFSPPNAIELGGRKVSGASGYADGSSLIHQGTVLIAADLDEMAEALALPAGHLRERLITVKDALDRTPDPREVRDAIGEGMSDAFRRPLQGGEMTAQERDLAERLHAELGSDAFVEEGDRADALPAASRPSATVAQDYRP